MGFTFEMTHAIAEKLVTLNELHRNRWQPNIVNLLLETDTLRFDELKKQLGITQKVLTENLKWLEENQIVVRTVYPDVPPQVEYSLTEIGK